MKKFFDGLLFLIIFNSICLQVFAICSVSACSLKDLQTETVVVENAINDYFDKNVKEEMFFNKNYKAENYNDLFLFNIIV